MKAEDKPKYLTELRKIISKLDADKLITSPDNEINNQDIRRAKAILTNFDFGDGQRLETTINEFLEVARAGKRIDHIRNLAHDIVNYIIQKTEDIDVYVIEPVKIKRRLESEGLWVESKIQGKDEHLFIGERNGKSDKVHLILDDETGEVRIDRKDQPPHDLIKKVETVLTMNTGEKIKSTRASLEFLDEKENDSSISVYPSDKRGHFLLEIYNSGDEDLDDFYIEISWKQPEGDKTRILEEFINDFEDPAMDYPHKLNVLKKGERKFAINIPIISVDKKINVSISCSGISSRKKIHKNFEFKTPNQYKQ